MFKSSKFKNTRSLNIFIGRNLKKTQKELLIERGFTIEQCGFCENDSIVKIDWKNVNGEYVINDIIYPYGFYCKEKECPGKSINTQSKEWLIKVKGMSNAEADLYLKNKAKQGTDSLRKSGWYDDISNNPFSKEFWIKKGYSENEAQKRVNERTKKSVSTMKKNGRYDDISNNPFSKEFWIKKGYGENEAQEIVNERNCFHPLFYKKLGYSDSDSLKMAKASSSTNTLSYYKKKYGSSIGTKKWNDRKKRWEDVYEIPRIAERYKVSNDEAVKIKERILENWINNFKECKYSKISYNLFKSIYDKLPNNIQEKCYFGDSEFGRYDRENDSYYYYDFVISSLKICIEFHGLKFHPKDNDRNWVQLFTNKSYDEVKLHDNNKKNLLEKDGWDYHIVWEDEVSDETKNKIFNIILNKYYERVQSKDKK